MASQGRPVATCLKKPALRRRASASQQAMLDCDAIVGEALCAMCAERMRVVAGDHDTRDDRRDQQLRAGRRSARALVAGFERDIGGGARARSPAMPSAISSACGRPPLPVAPSPTIAPSATITQPTAGIGRGAAELRARELKRALHERASSSGDGRALRLRPSAAAWRAPYRDSARLSPSARCRDRSAADCRSGSRLR